MLHVSPELLEAHRRDLMSLASHRRVTHGATGLVERARRALRSQG